jgi:hypothetical protein
MFKVYFIWFISKCVSCVQKDYTCKKKEQKYCSHYCYSENKKTRKLNDVECIICRRSCNNNRKTCSLECLHKTLSYSGTKACVIRYGYEDFKRYKCVIQSKRKL